MQKMNKVYKWGVSTILAIPFLIVSVVCFSTNGNNKKDNRKSELVVASLDVSGPSSLPETKASINRGEFITINARLKNDSAIQTGPYKIRFYLSRTQDGMDTAYEFDIFHDVFLDKPVSHSKTDNKQEFDNFHDVSPETSGSVFVRGRYAFPFSIGAGYNYWVVVEAGPDEKVIQNGENKVTRITSIISVPCDQFEAYIDGDTYNCPFKPGKED
jgi:hypothetical protein